MSKGQTAAKVLGATGKVLMYVFAIFFAFIAALFSLAKKS